MITFKSFLAEARMAPLYHGTDSVTAAKIIKSNTFLASSDWLGDIPDGVSFTRNISVARRFATKQDLGVVFEVNQNKLSHRYKIKPVNFFNGIGGSTREMDSSKNSGNNEYEERVFGQINNADSYIEKVIALAKPGKPYSGNVVLNHPKLWYNGKFVNK